MAHYLVIVESPAKVKTIKKVFGQQLYSCGFSGTCTGSSEKFTWNRCRTRLRTKIHYNKGEKGDILAALREKRRKKSDKVFLATTLTVKERRFRGILRLR